MTHRRRDDDARTVVRPCPQPCSHLSQQDAREGRTCTEHPCTCVPTPRMVIHPSDLTVTFFRQIRATPAFGSPRAPSPEMETPDDCSSDAC